MVSSFNNNASATSWQFHPSSNSTNALARRVSPRRRRTVARQRDQLATILRAEKTAPNHAFQRNPSSHQRQAISPETLLSRGIAKNDWGPPRPDLCGAVSDGRLHRDPVALANEHISIAHVIREAFDAQVDRQILVWKSGRQRCLTFDRPIGLVIMVA
jgi:hypothetical protein